MAGVKGRSGGHNRKTTQTLKEEGGYRTTRHANRADVLVEPAKLPCPEHLGPIGKEAWSRIINALPESVVTKLDADSLSAYCDCLEVYAKLRPMFYDDPI